ncbi:PD-(D/E)XK motif protein [Guptibacillus sedimenti]|uniref:PD-(D/E)XK motif protein n=1 Tax=Guptibacillus sedimenti TaxID=3025680 RepID=UPI00235DCCDF|nr:PD-(D/E)XK motif protein [Pseudalkalibacillus sedimenti]
MELVEEIRRKFANISINNASSINNLGELYNSWVLRIDQKYAVGIEVSDNTEVNESFSNVYYYTAELSVESKKVNMLILASSGEEFRSEFAGICALFLETGINGEKRKDIINSPLNWWEKWKSLLGNKNVTQSVHGALGELVFFYYLKQNDRNISCENWGGPKGNSHDFQIANYFYEVKSSIIKYNDIVNISGQYQLTKEEAGSLIFIKFEEVNNGISIEQVVNLLVDMGESYHDINKLLNAMGMLEKSQSRKKKFRILEARAYNIDESFPVIDVRNLNSHKLIEHVLQLNYKISLTGLEYRPIEIKIP